METLRANVGRTRGKTIVVEQDIRKINPLDMMRDLGLHAGELDLLCGEPPSQAFSQIGKRNSLNDDRGMLLFEMTRFAEAFQPKALMIEQVKGLLNAPDETGKAGGVFEQLIARLEKLGYAPAGATCSNAPHSRNLSPTPPKPNQAPLVNIRDATTKRPRVSALNIKNNDTNKIVFFDFFASPCYKSIW